MPKIYRYILTHDYGVAPCPDDGLITLATCKPTIRRCARPGDWVVGFRPGSLERGLVLWAGKVQRIMTHGQYQRAFRGRLDAVYRETRTGTYARLVEGYHPTSKEMIRDLSAPVLLFDPAASVYLNGQPALLPPELAHLAAGGRGHRVNGVREGDVERLAAWVASLDAPGNVPSQSGRQTCGARTKVTPRRAGCGSPKRKLRPVAETAPQAPYPNCR